MSKTTTTIIGILFLGLLAAGIIYVSKLPRSNPGEEVFCTLDAKLCPDGSYVGRVGPSCEFAECPADTATEDWETATTTQGISFKYPPNLGTTYINTVDWPPQIEIIEETFSCTEAGEETARAGATRRVTINSRDYCLTKVSEGAAGSTYTQYAYATEVEDGKVAYMRFSLRFPQCGNYDDPKKTECETERTAFDIDLVADRIMQTLQP